MCVSFESLGAFDSSSTRIVCFLRELGSRWIKQYADRVFPSRAWEPLDWNKGRFTDRGLLRRRQLKNAVTRPGNFHAGLRTSRFIPALFSRSLFPLFLPAHSSRPYFPPFLFPPPLLPHFFPPLFSRHSCSRHFLPPFLFFSSYKISCRVRCVSIPVHSSEHVGLSFRS